MLPEDARKLWCPFKRVFTTWHGNVVVGNDNITNDPDDRQRAWVPNPADKCKCMAPDCMGWDIVAQDCLFLARPRRPL